MVNPFSSAPSAGGASNPFSSAPAPKPTATPTPVAPTPKSPTTEAITKSFSSVLQLDLPPQTVPEPEPLLYGPAEPWPTTLPSAFPHFFLDAENETLEPEQPLPEQNVTIDDSGEGPSSGGGGAEAADSNLDKTFQRFADRVAQNPEQVLRYERCGLPLLYSADDEVGKLLKDVKDGAHIARKLPKCGNCGKKERVFEFQLMPHFARRASAGEDS